MKYIECKQEETDRHVLGRSRYLPQTVPSVDCVLDGLAEIEEFLDLLWGIKADTERFDAKHVAVLGLNDSACTILEPSTYVC